VGVDGVVQQVQQSLRRLVENNFFKKIDVPVLIIKRENNYR
jgi:hypothetical protein